MAGGRFDDGDKRGRASKELAGTKSEEVFEASRHSEGRTRYVFWGEEAPGELAAYYTE